MGIDLYRFEQCAVEVGPDIVCDCCRTGYKCDAAQEELR